MSNWHETYSNVTALGAWLKDHHGFDADDLQRYYEVPRKWDQQWELFQIRDEEGVPCECPGCGAVSYHAGSDLDLAGQPSGDPENRCPLCGFGHQYPAYSPERMNGSRPVTLETLANMFVGPTSPRETPQNN